MSNTEKEIVIINSASPIMSFIEDLFTFGGFISLLWFNHAYLNGNGWLDMLFIFGWLLTMASYQSRRIHRFKTKQAAIDYIKNEVE